MPQKFLIHIFSALLAIAFSSAELSAQQADGFYKGHYFSTKPDPVAGYFDIDNWNEGTVFYKKTTDIEATRTRLHPADVEKIVLENGGLLISREMKVGVSSDRIFIKQIIGSEIKMYEGLCKNLLLGPVFFVSTIDHPEIIWINRNAIKAPFEALFPECGYEKSVFYNRTSIQNIVRHYQRCRYKTEVDDLTNKGLKCGLAFGAKMIGTRAVEKTTYYTNVNGQINYFTDRQDYFAFTGGLNAQLWFSKKFALDLDLIYRKSTDAKAQAYRSSFLENYINGSGEAVPVNQVYQRPAVTDFHFLQLPFGVRGIVKDRPGHQLFLAAKASGMIKLAQKNRYLSEETPYTKVFRGESFDFGPTRQPAKKFGMLFEAGLREEIGKKLALEIALFYARDEISYDYFDFSREKARVRVHTGFWGISLAFTDWHDLSKKREGN